MPGILNASGVEIARFAAPVSVRSVSNSFRVGTANLRTKSATPTNAQRFEVTAKLHVTDDGAGLMAHTVIYDSITPFLITVPQVFRRTATAQSVLTASAASAGSNTVNFSGSGTMLTGDFIRFASHAKLYMVASVSGNSATIYPPLVGSVPAGGAIETMANTKMLVTFSPDTIKGISYSDGVLTDFGECKFEEYL